MPYDPDKGDVSTSAFGDEPAGADKIRIVCHGCGARYYVRAGKVSGRRFRATCKKCGGIIIVQAPEAANDPTEETEHSEEMGLNSRPLHLTGDDLRQDDDAVWYVVVAGKPHGPISAAHVRDSFAAGRIGLRSYLWKAGDAEWRRMADIVDFADLTDRETAFYQKGEDASGHQGTGETRAATPRRLAAWSGGDASRPQDLAPALDTNEASPDEHTTLFGEGRLDPLEPLDAEPTRYVVRTPTAGGGEGMAAGLAQLAATVAAQREVGEPPAHPRDELSGPPPAGAWAQVPLIQPRRAVLPPPSGFSRPMAASPLVGSPTVPPPGAFSRPAAASPLAPPPPEVSRPLGSPAPGAMVLSTRPVTEAERAKLFASEPVHLPIPPAPEPPKPAPPVPAPPLRNVFEDSLRPVGPPAPGPALLAPAAEPFWTSGRIAAAAAVAGGLSVAVAVIVVVSLVRPNQGALQRVVPVPVPQSATPVPTAQPAAPVSPGAAAPVAAAAPAQIPATPTPAAPAPAAPAPAAPAPAVAQAPASAHPGDSAAEEGRIPISVQSSEAPPPAPKASSAARPPASGGAAKGETGKEARRKIARGPGRKRGKGQDDVSSSEVDKLLGAGTTPKPSPAAKEAVDPDSLLSAGGGSEKSRATAPAGGAPDPDALLGAGAAAPARSERPTKEQIRTAIQGVMAGIRACRDQYSATGTLRMQITVRGSGSAEARPLGEFAGTPAGGCFASALQKARFPAFSGPAFSFQYPFNL